ncbi:MAG: hypothetical protein SNJ70_04525 [Armatimonadota bacterium]
MQVLLKTKKVKLFIIILFIFIQSLQVCFSQDSKVRISTWNISYYTGPDSRDNDIKNAVYGSYMGRSFAPDIILGQEFIDAGAVTHFKNLLNTATGSPGDWEAAPFINGPDTDSAFFYRTSFFDLINYIVVQNGGPNPEIPRNLMRYDVAIKGYPTASTPIIAMYSSHMKAGTSSTDRARRLREAQLIRNDAQVLNPSWSFLYGGDTNIQNSNEAAYQKLVGSESNNNGRFFDPINSPGNWNNNSYFRFIHTQDPIGAGGMDDRHDQLLISEDLIDGVGLDYIGNPAIPYSTSTWDDPNHSYRCWGNDGTSFDTTLTVNGNAMVGPMIAQALINTAKSSGHLPVFLDLRLPNPLTVTVSKSENQYNPTNDKYIKFRAVFSESISGFTSSDVIVSGTAGGNKTVFVTGNGAVYDIAVGGITSPGTVIVSIPENSAVSASNQVNFESENINNSVNVFHIGPFAMNIKSISNEYGPNTLGLRVKVCGQVSNLTQNQCDISDGSGTIKIDFSNAAINGNYPLENGKYISVSGNVTSLSPKFITCASYDEVIIY